MRESRPIFDPATHYRVEVRGGVDLAWLQSFDTSAEIRADGLGTDLTVLDVRTDQAGIVGLLRRLHGLGVTIEGMQVVPEVEG